MRKRVRKQDPGFQAGEENRKPYRPPRVETLGRLRDLTRGAHVGGLLDVGSSSAY